MAGNGNFWQKSITQNRKTFITQPKHMVFIITAFIISEKKIVFCFGRGP